MHFLRNGVRSSAFGAALTAACVANCVVVVAAVAAESLLTANITVLVCGVSFFFCDSIFVWLSDLSSSCKFVTNESGKPE